MKVSAGLLMCRRSSEAGLQLLLVHPGGPFHARKDDGVWTVPKGLVAAGEDPLQAARREFREETGFDPPDEPSRYRTLGHVRHKGGKRVYAWAFEGDCDPDAIESNTFELEWPPRSGRVRSFPEVDRAGFFEPATARRKLLPAQTPFVARACNVFGVPCDDD